jgi:hypothetical protein
MAKDAGSVVAGCSSTLLLRQQPTQDFYVLVGARPGYTDGLGV